MRSVLSCILAAPVLMAAAPAVPPTFGLDCAGSETVRNGDGDGGRTVPYAIRLNIDLPRWLYCYAQCGRDQTYPIADPAAVPIRLADIDFPAQSRHLLLDPLAMTIVDDQHITVAPLHMNLIRHATARCRPAAFHAPPAD